MALVGRLEHRLDRARTCPLLLRVFVQAGAHHAEREYSAEGVPPARHALNVYTWRDATLRELAEQVKVQFAEARECAALDFALVFPNASGQHVLKRVGRVAAAPGAHVGDDDGLTLGDIKHQAGDYLDVALLPR